MNQQRNTWMLKRHYRTKPGGIIYRYTDIYVYVYIYILCVCFHITVYNNIVCHAVYV